MKLTMMMKEQGTGVFSTVSSLTLAVAMMGQTACVARQGAVEDSMTASVSVVNAKIDDVKVQFSTKNGKRIATFAYSNKGTLTTFVKLYAPDEVTAETNGSKTDLFLDGRGIGFVDNKGLLKICDDYTYEGHRYSYQCDAVFYTPVAEQVGKAQASVRINFTDASVKDGVSPLPAPSGNGLSLTSGGGLVDLSEWAQNQINQYSTGTCLYNSTTGLLEWFYARTTGVKENFSEGDVLARLPLPASYAPELEALDGATSLRTIAKDSVLPTDWLYRQFNDFNSAQAYALSYETSLDASADAVVPLDLRLRGELLYWYGRNVNGYATPAELQKLVNWITVKRSPVQLFANYSGIWHSIMVIGYDPASQQFLIKDSLGNTNIKGSWQSKEFILQFSYGAVGYTSDKPFLDTNSQPQQAAPSEGPAAENNPPSSNPPGTTPNNDALGNDSSTSAGPNNGASPSSGLDEDLCYLGWVPAAGGTYICAMWNIHDQQRTGKVHTFIPSSLNTANVCRADYVRYIIGTDGYNKMYQHCNGRYAVWTGRYY